MRAGRSRRRSAQTSLVHSRSPPEAGPAALSRRWFRVRSAREPIPRDLTRFMTKAARRRAMLHQQAMLSVSDGGSMQRFKETSMGELKFSNALIIGQVVDETSERPIANTIVGLDSVMAQGQRVQLFNAHDQPVQNLNDRTGTHGVFILPFHWDPTALGSTLDMPTYRLNISLPLDGRAIDYRRATRREGRLAAVVSLREVGSG